MKLYNTPMPAPNPRRVRIFLAEKGVEVPLVDVALVKGEHKAPEHVARNSLGQTPVLELEDGTCISETVAICRYLERLHPEPAMFGRGALEEALVEMWVRRVEFQLMGPAGNFWRHAHPFTARVVVPQYKEFGEANQGAYEKALMWLDGELAGRDFVAGEVFTMADICALSTVNFADWTGLKVPEAAENLRAWRGRVSARPSAGA
ncbi:glutathione S-transferase family protein [Hyphomonas sp.]|uniref:glutathione S-transferase family protein n=1 Tax=Hyphomonas sp. TaxID=87 RepID=UPI003340F3A8